MLKRTVLDLANLDIYGKKYIDIETADEESKSKIITDNGYNFIVDNYDMDIDEINIALKIAQIKEIKSIKRMVLFFVILTIISMVVVAGLYLNAH